MKTIYKNAFSKYAINESKLLRYANRRGKKEELKNYLTANNNKYCQNIENDKSKSNNY